MGTYPSVYYRTNEVKVLPTMFSNKYSENDLDVPYVAKYIVLLHYRAFLCRKAKLGGHGHASPPSSAAKTIFSKPIEETYFRCTGSIASLHSAVL